MEKQLTDKQLIKKILDAYGWQQKDLAEALCISSAAISQFKHGVSVMRGSTRRLAERLLEDANKQELLEQG